MDTFKLAQQPTSDMIRWLKPDPKVVIPNFQERFGEKIKLRQSPRGIVVENREGRYEVDWDDFLQSREWPDAAKIKIPHADIDELADAVAEALIGEPDFVDHSIVAGILVKGRSVCRIRTFGIENFDKVAPADRQRKWEEAEGEGRISRTYATGWILGESRKVLITNNHVFPLKEPAASAKVELGYEKDIHGDITAKARLDLNPEELFITNVNMRFNGLDYTAVALKVPSPEEFGYLEPMPGRTCNQAVNIFVVQHPNGAPKSYIVNHNKKLKNRERYFAYESDTLDGSSGAPLFDDELNLIGLHHFGNWTIAIHNKKMKSNLGSRIEHVIADLAQQLRISNWDRTRVREYFGSGAVLDGFDQAASD